MTESPAAGGHKADTDKPKEEPNSLPLGPNGQFLKELGINSKRLPDSIGTFGSDVETIEVAADDIEQTMRRLRTSPETGFDCLLMVSGVDSPETFDSVYHLWSYTDAKKEMVVKVRIVKTSVPEGRLPVVPSIANYWPTANWHEREEFDLVGIKYAGHPYLRRLMNPWDWDGHPLRRDYKQPVDALNDKNPHSMR
jgi:NADH-quinone oxidoreductase subunit C